MLSKHLGYGQPSTTHSTSSKGLKEAYGEAAVEKAMKKVKGLRIRSGSATQPLATPVPSYFANEDRGFSIFMDDPLLPDAVMPKHRVPISSVLSAPTATLTPNQIKKKDGTERPFSLREGTKLVKSNSPSCK